MSGQDDIVFGISCLKVATSNSEPPLYHDGGCLPTELREAHRSKREKIKTTFWPPNPKLLFMTCLQRIGRAVLGT